jgi:hypothetical protein
MTQTAEDVLALISELLDEFQPWSTCGYKDRCEEAYTTIAQVFAENAALYEHLKTTYSNFSAHEKCCSVCLKHAHDVGDMLAAIDLARTSGETK